MSESWPTQVEQTTETYESTYGNEATVTQTTWPAGVIHQHIEEPEPPGGFG